MEYLVVSDLHGDITHIKMLFSLLHEKGWSIVDGHLYSENQTLIVAGDTIDRGSASIPLAHLLWTNDNGSVVSLMGNHDIKLYQYFYEGRVREHEDALPTMESLAKNQDVRQEVALAITRLPYVFTGKTFNVAHAYYSHSKQLCIYGPKDEDKLRLDWWEDETPEKLTIFGHYHHLPRQWVDTRNGSICVDTWDGGVFTFAQIDDEKGNVYVWELPDHDGGENPLYEYFSGRYNL